MALARVSEEVGGNRNKNNKYKITNNPLGRSPGGFIALLDSGERLTNSERLSIHSLTYI